MLHSTTSDSSKDTSIKDKYGKRAKESKGKSIETNGNRKCEWAFQDYQAVKASTSDADA